MNEPLEVRAIESCSYQGIPVVSIGAMLTSLIGIVEAGVADPDDPVFVGMGDHRCAIAYIAGGTGPDGNIVTLTPLVDRPHVLSAEEYAQHDELRSEWRLFIDSLGIEL